MELRSKGKLLRLENRVVVFIETVLGPAPPRLSKAFRLTFSGLQLKPELLVVSPGDSIELYNDDKDEHAPYSNSPTSSFMLLPARRSFLGSRVFQYPGPHRVQCDRHDWERADVLVVSNPYFSLPAADGRWRIEGVPSGKHTVVFWETNGAVRKIERVECGELLPVVLEQAEVRLRRRSGELLREAPR